MKEADMQPMSAPFGPSGSEAKFLDPISAWVVTFRTGWELKCT